MSTTQTAKDFNKELHVSHSQIFAYMNCSLKYQHRYVLKTPPERVSVALPFGSAVHRAIELFYRSVEKGAVVTPEAICERFQAFLDLDLSNPEVPIIYKKEMPDKQSALDLGDAMLSAFHKAASKALEKHEIVGVEMPLSATLYTPEGRPTDYKLVGIIDLLLKDESGELIVVDNKTASKPMAQATADDDNQMTSYSYLLAANKHVFPTAPVKCRFDLLRKLKTPKLEHVYTTRTAEQRKRFAKVANVVLAGIEAGFFMPQPSWMCSDCEYANICRTW